MFYNYLGGCLLDSWFRAQVTVVLEVKGSKNTHTSGDFQPPQEGWKAGTKNALLTRALLGGGGGGGAYGRPLRFFGDSDENGGETRWHVMPPGFRPLAYHLFRNFCENLTPERVMSGQVTQPQNNLPIGPRLQSLRESYETFGII